MEKEKLNEILLKDGDTSFILYLEQDIIFGIIPELMACKECENKNPAYISGSVWDHIVRAVSEAPKDLKIRMTMLLHDIGKPACIVDNALGIRHFHGHAAISGIIAEYILRRLGYYDNFIREVCKLIRWHSVRFAGEDDAVKE